MKLLQSKQPLVAMLKRHIAFTLAEVLITLGIIGIVAALTIPVLMREYQKIEYTAKLKKFYSEFAQGIRAYMYSKGCTTLDCTGLFYGFYYDGVWDKRIQGEFASVFKITKDCLSGSTECQQNSKYLKGSTTYTVFNVGYSYLTTDGFLVGLIGPASGGCTGYSSTTSSSKIKNYCANLTVDSNGSSGPNTLGRDVWKFFIGNDGNLYPQYGMDDAKAQNNSDINWATSPYYWASSGYDFYCGVQGSSDIANNTTGLGCGARVIDEGWVMNY